MKDTARHTTGIRELLTGRRREMHHLVQGRIRENRTDRPIGGRDDLEHTDADAESEVAHSVLQMRADTVNRIDDAIGRIDAGAYGRCVDCARPIAAGRLAALPFAVRCRACEQRREAVAAPAV